MVAGEGSLRRSERHPGTISQSKRERVAALVHAKTSPTNDDVTVQK